MVRLAQEGVSLHSEPDLRSRVLALLSASAEIEVVVNIRNAGLDWIEVRTSAGLGYIRADSKLEACELTRGSPKEKETPAQTGAPPTSWPRLASTCLSVVLGAAIGMWISAEAFRKPIGFATLPNGMAFAQMGPDPVWMFLLTCLGGGLGWLLDTLGRRRVRR